MGCHRGDAHGDGVPCGQAAWQEQDPGSSWERLGVRMLLIAGVSSLRDARGGQRGADQRTNLSRRGNYPMLPPQPPPGGAPFCPGAW